MVLKSTHAVKALRSTLAILRVGVGNRPISKVIEEMRECKELVSMSFGDSAQIDTFTVTPAEKS